ncbi:MAG: hypothetical protein JWP52_788 [Rhizobacter sp.]|nr:hypothetical protein [Rhizobacter sp.]
MAKPDAHAHGDTVVKRVSSKHHDEGHGGAWKVAFADFCLALLCLFLVLWLMASRDKEAATEALRAAGGGMLDGAGKMPVMAGGPRGSLIDRTPVPLQGDTLTPRKRFVNGNEVSSDFGGPRNDTGEPVRLSKRTYDKPSDLPELARALEQLGSQAGLSANMQTIITPYGLRVLLHDTDREGMFERGSAMPSARFRQLLRSLAPLFAQIDNQLLVVGHTDSVPFNDRSPGAISNWSLSTDRAMAARTHLLMGGMPANSVLQVMGMADRAPLDTKDPRADINRRIELMVLTTGQARSVASMFGLPDATRPLVEGADSAQPDDPAVRELRSQLLSSRNARTPTRE